MSSRANSFYSAAFYTLLVICIGGGLAIYRKASVEPGRNTEKPATQKTDPETKLQSDPESLTAPNNPSPTYPGAPASRDQMDTLEAYTRLVDAGVPVHIDPFSGSSGSLTDAAVDLLSLDQEQKDEVQSTIEAARLEIERLRKQSATTHIDESGQLSVTCPAFPERGDQIRNILLESLSSKLEDSQFELLQDISNDWKELDSSHSDFGQTNLTFTFKVQIVKEEVRIKAERHSDAANPPNRTWSYWPRFLNRNVAGGPKEYLDPESTRYLIEIAARMQTELDSSETTPRP